MVSLSFFLVSSFVYSIVEHQTVSIHLGCFSWGHWYIDTLYSLSCICSTNALLDSFKQKSHSPTPGATGCHAPCPWELLDWREVARPVLPTRPVLGVHMVLEGREWQWEEWNAPTAPRNLQGGKTQKSMVAWTLGLLIPRNLVLSTALSSARCSLESYGWACKGIK